MVTGALSHLRILDLSRVLAGPWCAQNLADLGADVIKVEKPGEGDDTRRWGPPYLRDEAGHDTSEAAYFLGANRNKRSITLNLSTPEGQEIVRQLTAQSDVVIENYKVGQLKKYGLDYASLKAIKPDVVYCSITGFGQTGPYAHRPGYDFIVQGMGGLMSITGETTANGGTGPQKVGVAVADLFTGMYATSAILAALAYRDRTGIGQHIDMALLDVQVAMLANIASTYLTSGEVPSQLGNTHTTIVPYQTFQTSDSWIIVAAGNDSQFRHFVEVGGEAHLADDPRYATNPERVRHRDTLVPLLAEMVKRHSKADWIARLEAANVPCGPINNFAEVFANEQVVARGLRIETSHPTGGKVPMVASPMRLSETPPLTRRHPPLLGEHTEEVLRERLQVDTDTLQAWRKKGVI